MQKYICKFCDKNYGNICVDQHAAAHCTSLSDKDISEAKTKAKLLDVIGKLRKAVSTSGH